MQGPRRRKRAGVDPSRNIFPRVSSNDGARASPCAVSEDSDSESEGEEEEESEDTYLDAT